MAAKGEGGGRHKQDFGINRYTILYTKQINTGLLYSTGNYAQYLVITIMEKNLKKNTYMHIMHIYIYTHTHTHTHTYKTEKLKLKMNINVYICS